MIEHIKTKGFKGFSIDEPVHQKTIYTGKNKSGKSSRSQAIALTILGYIPFAAKTNKKPADILNDFGVGDSLTTAITSNGVEFERHFSRSESGSVSQRLRVDQKKVSAQDFAVELSRAGDPRIVDVNDFMLMSDQKKIDVLFSLFPPDADLKSLESKIDKAKTKVNELQAKERTFLSVIQRLTASKNDIQLPAGSLPEIRANIEKLTAQVKAAQGNLKQIEIEEAKESAKADQKKSSQAEFDKIMKSKEAPFVPGDGKTSLAKIMLHDEFDKEVESYSPILTGMENLNLGGVYEPEAKNLVAKYAADEAVMSIQKIIDTMLDAGCDVCAGLMVAKQELTTTTVQTVPSKCRCPQSTICGTNSGHCEFFNVEDETCLYGKI